MRRCRLVAAAALVATGMTPAAAEDCSPAPGLVFDRPVRVDPLRPGANPSLVKHPSGALVLTAAPLEQRIESEPEFGYLSSSAGQSPVWRSTTGGTTWQYVGASSLAGPARPGAGLSDPDLAVDAAGSLYHVESSMALASVSRSGDGGSFWSPAGPAAAANVDRPWISADEADVVYLTTNESPRRFLSRSTDGGTTFARVAELPGGYAEPVVDRNGRIFASYTRTGPGAQPGRIVAVARIPDARAGSFAVQKTTLLDGRVNLDQDALAVDGAGNVYVVWTQTWTLEYPGGVWYAYSRDGGTTFSQPVRLDDGNRDELTVAMPAVVAAGAGRVAVAWLQSSRAWAKDDPNSFPEAEWAVHVAVSSTAAGCAGSPPLWSVSLATPAVHGGPMGADDLCDVGNGNDSRMGRFMSAATTADGRLVIAYPDTTATDPFTRRGAAVAHPGVVVSLGTL